MNQSRPSLKRGAPIVAAVFNHLWHFSFFIPSPVNWLKMAFGGQNVNETSEV
jgi:hypothetical protein